MLSETGFRFCPNCGSATLTDFETNAMKCRTCGFIYHHNVASAVAAIIEVDDSVVLVRRTRDPGRGLLDLPGGFVDAGESLEQAIMREVREELGISIRNPVYFGSAPNDYSFKNVLYHTADSFFVCSAELADAIATDEIDQIVVCRAKEIDPRTLAFQSTRSMLMRYRALRQTR